MKKLILAFLGAVILTGCGADKGGDFVGEWEAFDGEWTEVVIIEKTPSGYKVSSTIEDISMFNLNVMLEADSDTLLVNPRDRMPKLELQEDGQMLSSLRREKKTMARVD